MTITLTLTTLASDGTTIDAGDVVGPDNQLIGYANALRNGSTSTGADIEALLFDEITVPATPASTKWKLYFKTTGLYTLEDTGTEVLISPVGSSHSLSDLLTIHVFS